VVAGVEGDLRVLRQVRLHVDVQAEEVAEGRHGAGLAVGEVADELPLLGQVRVVGVRGQAQALQVHLPVGGHHRQHMLPIQVHHHRLGHLPAGDVRRPRHRRGREGQRVRDDLVRHPVRPEEFHEPGHGHGSLLGREQGKDGSAGRGRPQRKGFFKAEESGEAEESRGKQRKGAKPTLPVSAFLRPSAD